MLSNALSPIYSKAAALLFGLLLGCFMHTNAFLLQFEASPDSIKMIHRKGVEKGVSHTRLIHDGRMIVFFDYDNIYRTYSASKGFELLKEGKLLIKPSQLKGEKFSKNVLQLKVLPGDIQLDPGGKYAWIISAEVRKIFKSQGKNKGETSLHSNRTPYKLLLRLNLYSYKLEVIKKLDCQASNLLIHPEGNYLVVNTDCQDELKVIYMNDHGKVAQFRLGAKINDLAFHPQKDILYCTLDGSLDIRSIDLANKSMRAISMQLPSPTMGKLYGSSDKLLLDPLGSFVFVLQKQAKQIIKYDLNREKILNIWSCPDIPVDISLSLDGYILYVLGRQEGGISKLRTTDMKWIAYAEIPRLEGTTSFPYSLTYDPKQHFLWVSDRAGFLHIYEDTGEKEYATSYMSHAPVEGLSAVPKEENLNDLGETTAFQLDRSKQYFPAPEQLVKKTVNVSRQEMEDELESKGPNFTIILGSFNRREDAINYQAELKKEYRINALIISRPNGGFRISSGSYESELAAQPKLNKLREQIRKDAWVLEMTKE